MINAQILTSIFSVVWIALSAANHCSAQTELPTTATIVVRFDESKRAVAVEVNRLSPQTVALLRKSCVGETETPNAKTPSAKTPNAELRLDEERAAAFFTLHVLASNMQAEPQPLAGSWFLSDLSLSFRPRYPFRAGVSYRARWKDPASDSSKSTEPLALDYDFALPATKSDREPSVVKVFPTAASLPENHLRFYIRFDTPMSRGDAYSHLELIRDDGFEVPSPFLEIGEELWDRSNKRFTLLLDPGRVKHALVPRQELGPILVSGHSYTLKVKPGWPDANGERMKTGYQHRFRVGDAQHEVVALSGWKVSEPTLGTREQLVLTFPVTLDSALAERTIYVVNEANSEISGKITLQDEERCWTFVPDQAWGAGRYRVQVEPSLEDSAGNNVAVALEVTTDGIKNAPGSSLPVQSLPIRIRPVPTPTSTKQ